MKRRLLTVVSAILVLFVVASCGKKNGTDPDELKALIDEAHSCGVAVVMDLVHSHSVSNEDEGLGYFDGDPSLYFHRGSRRVHPAWE